jgi:hypothetical protein
MNSMLRASLLCALALGPIGCGAPTVLPHVAADAGGAPRGAANISSALPAAAHRVTHNISGALPGYGTPPNDGGSAVDPNATPPAGFTATTDTLKAVPI